MKVELMYEEDKLSDWVCDLTKFMDKYRNKLRSKNDWDRTYLWHNIESYEEIVDTSYEGNISVLKVKRYYICFRLPGSTRGAIDLVETSDPNKFLIREIRFNPETCYGDLGCYVREVEKDTMKFLGAELDFTDVLKYAGTVRDLEVLDDG